MTKQLNLTVLEWYEMLPVKLRDKAQAYACEDGSYDGVVESLSAAIFLGFVWNDTVEGAMYWTMLRLNNAPRYQSAYIKKHNL